MRRKRTMAVVLLSILALVLFGMGMAERWRGEQITKLLNGYDRVDRIEVSRADGAETVVISDPGKIDLFLRELKPGVLVRVHGGVPSGERMARASDIGFYTDDGLLFDMTIYRIAEEPPAGEPVSFAVGDTDYIALIRDYAAALSITDQTVLDSVA